MEKGKKMALVVGCNYPSTPTELHGCHNDALAMHEVLITRFGFDPKHVELLTDKPGSSIMPTGANIKSALNRMIDQAGEGDVLFFHYSGHGTLIKSHNWSKKEEAIVPCDFNLITSVDFRQIVNRVPKGATFTILSDSCHSGGLIDKEKEQIGPYTTPDDTLNIPSRSYKQKEIPFQSIIEHFASLTSKINSDIGTHVVEVFGKDASLMFRDEAINEPLKADEGILLSGCQMDEYSADVEDIGEDGKTIACGAFSNAFQMVLKENPEKALSNRDVVVMARKILSSQHFGKQHPCLYCSDQNADAVFLGTPN
ncbi:hypothetical protein CASFOL_032519 [Castilleja foliolosa]|uniref:Peptidase C14 caspase domain-containing protein n=1 Tax=Castilleja foliolosa TaxID=1961234 RepID=A0ABD3C2J0_9LAMI